MMEEKKFCNRLVEKPVTLEEQDELAMGHDGVIKVVVDIKQKKMAAGGQWHTDCLKLLEEEGSVAENCWGAKYNVDTGEMAYKSQINKNRGGSKTEEIFDSEIKGAVLSMVQEYLKPKE